ncbi:6955_t:CDS:2 [Funneliformis mosseae]|uniref:6955_t:CDS:1 n=1 Tax=Funneliformis mosseae TaxID=27381 RepID=A0A9N9EWN3_FUNMO|nr:6955_t:CDS:2 [Funneliformis mosseae]
MSDSPSSYITSNSSSTRFLRDNEISQYLTNDKMFIYESGSKGKSIIINENSKSTLRGSEATREVDIKEEKEEECCQEIINVVR